MTRELWARNPHSYVRELAEVGLTQVSWDRGLLRKYRIDATKHANAHFRPGVDYRLLLTGDQGTAELTRDHGFANPKAVYPTWEYGQHDLDDLEWLVAENRAEELRHNALMEGLPPDEIPVVGQEHRVVIIRPPRLSTGVGKKFLETLAGLAGDYPDCILHYHGTYSLRPWAAGITAIDLDLRRNAASNVIQFPDGKVVSPDRAPEFRRWLDLFGFSVQELEVPRNRCMFNVRSMIYAAEHWDDRESWLADEPFRAPDFRMIVNGGMPTPTKIKKPILRRPRGVKALPGDKLYCEACSFAENCTLYRVGSVCRVADSPGNELADLFSSRNAGKILDALGAMLGEEVDRYKQGRAGENLSGEIDPNVSKISDAIMKHGAALAKLRDPNLQKPLLALQVNGGNGAMQITTGSRSGMTERELASHAVAALEAGGVDRDFITHELIEDYKEAYLENDLDGMHEIIRRAASESVLPELTTSPYAFDSDPEIEDAVLED